MDDNVTLIASTVFGLESIVGKEVKGLGFTDIKIENGKVEYKTDIRGIVKSNLWIRSAERIFMKVAEFEAKSFEKLFDQINEIPWENVLPKGSKFPVDAKSVKSTLYSLSDIQRISKKAIAKRLLQNEQTDWVIEDGDEYKILVSILKDRVVVSIDSSGKGLHKRGYREIGNEAPIKETLAAGLVKISNWRNFIPLIDPMCGTGTIVIEAALIGRNIAPGLNRKFASENWGIIPTEMWKEERQLAYKAINFSEDFPIIKGYDINKRSIDIAKANAEKAGVEDFVEFEVRDVKDLKSEDKYGYIICNPPYGERLGDELEVEQLYEDMGKAFRKLDTWSNYVITSYEYFEKAFKKRSTKNRKLYNGRIRCYYYQFFGPRPPKKQDRI